MNNRLIKSNDAGGGGGCTNTVDLYNPFPDGGGVALYQLNGDATDESGNYNGTAIDVTYGAGEFGQAAVFTDPNTRKIDLPSSLNANVFNPTSQFSLSMWIKMNDITRPQYLFNCNTPNNVNLGVDSNNQGDGKVVWTIYNTSYAFLISTTTITTGVWYNVVVTYNNGFSEMFIDNVSQGTITKTLVQSSEKVTLGYRENLPLTEAVNGSIDQVRIFNRALRPYEVEALYTEEYCTPTIVPSEHFNTVLYTGQGGSESITNVGFQPDLTWIKGRDTSGKWNVLYDSIRGTNKMLSSNVADSEATYGSVTPTSTGFDLGSLAGDLNSNGEQYVSWNFKAGGAAVTNTDGTITSQVSANTEAGFSVVSYTGNGANATIGHGLENAPSMVIVKNRQDSAENWNCWHTGLSGYNYRILLNQTAAEDGTSPTIWNSNIDPTSLTFSVGTAPGTNGSGNSMIAYCFAEVEGFSNFGSYVGTGASGNTVVTGFEPAFVMIKAYTSADNWVMIDNKRGVDNRLYADLSNAEGTLANRITFAANGFTLTTSAYNASGFGFIYMAFAADPTAVEPTLEDSFNTVLYTGNGTSQAITGVGFQPDFTWLKSRTTNGLNNFVLDGLRSNKYLSTDNTSAEITTSGFSGFTSDGFNFTLGGTLYNGSGNNYVAWNWKGAEIPAINSNGSIPSVVSANPAAGFSIVTFTGNGQTGATVGHGLGTAPAVVINKGRANLATYNNWYVWHKDLPNPNTDLLILNNTDAVGSDGNYFGGSPTDSTLIFGNDIYGPNVNGTTYVNYVFAEVAGFSKFGSYAGNGLTGASGPSITTGFEPAFLLVKHTNGTGAWFIMDNKRSPTNPRQLLLQPASSAAEENVGNAINFNSNGFQILDANYSRNASGQTYIYMAFANQF